MLAEISRLAEHYGLRVANVFHAGDGNLHPLILYDSSRPGDEEKAEALCGAYWSCASRRVAQLPASTGWAWKS